MEEEIETARGERLSGQVAVVTGGAGGIGRATCLQLFGEGANVVVIDIDEERVDEAVAMLEHHGNAVDARRVPLGLVLDVRRDEDMHRVAQQTLDRFGRIDILVASAGILRRKGSSLTSLVEMRVEEWDDVIDTNLKGVFLSNRAVLPTMIEQRRGHIINISSTSGREGRAFDSAYSASKFGVIGLSEALAQEVSRYGVKVNVVLPAAVDTAMWEQNAPIPQPEEILPAERVADLIVYLLTLPEDTILLEPVIAPFRTRRRSAAIRKQ